MRICRFSLALLFLGLLCGPAAIVAAQCPDCDLLGELSLGQPSVTPGQPRVGDTVTFRFPLTYRLPSGFNCSMDDCGLAGGGDFLSGGSPASFDGSAVVVQRLVTQPGADDIHLHVSAYTESQCYYPTGNSCSSYYAYTYVDRDSPSLALQVVEGCSGDCNGDAAVTIDELLIMVNVALSLAPVANCTAGDFNHDGEITIDEIIRALAPALTGCPQNGPESQGLLALQRGDIRAASQAFQSAAAADPQNARAALLRTVTRAGTRFADEPSWRLLAQRAGVAVSGSSADVCDLDVDFPSTVPVGAPRSGEILAAADAVLVPEIEAWVSELRALPVGTTISFDVRNLPSCLRPNTDTSIVEIDHGDLLILEAALEILLGWFDLANGYNLDAPLYSVVEQSQQSLFSTQPNLLKLQSAARLGSARAHFGNGFARLVEAIDSIRAETDDQDDDILVIDSDDIDEARKARLFLTYAQAALNGLVSLPVDVVTGMVDLMEMGLSEHERLNLAPLFSGQLTNLRTLLPPFKPDGHFDGNHLPDPHFGGIAPDMTQSKLEHFLEGGPGCAVCDRDEDCNAFGLGAYFCAYCDPYFRPCTGEQRRCSQGYEECVDGIFLY